MPAKSFLLICCFSFTLFGQGGRSTVTVGVGGGFPTGGDNVYLTSTLPDSAAFSAAYEFRVLKYFAPDLSVVNLIPSLVQYTGGGPLPPMRERVTLVSVGARGLLPLHQGRIELFAGAAVVAVSGSGSYLHGLNASLWQLNGGGRIAIGKGRHFWVGPTLRFSRNGGRPTEEFVALTGDFGFRF